MLVIGLCTYTFNEIVLLFCLKFTNCILQISLKEITSQLLNIYTCC